jgi:two-component system sensor histidine kinase KdpD
MCSRSTWHWMPRDNVADDLRPDPDHLLAEVQRAEKRARRGRLRIFFGATAGVGKTYSMLESARTARASGSDIVVGYVELHGRPETERLLEGLELIPPLAVGYRGIIRREFDLDAALRRRAGITLVDELAHSNLLSGDPPPRHAKRWQDIEEMLEAGLEVWTTLNVQHIESLNDVVAGITGVRQQETVPDHVVEQADDIELIDLPPDDLLARLRDGKVYVPEQVGTAVDRYFRKPNLIALRELALRQTADRVDAAARQYQGSEPSSRPWLARDRFIVGVAPDGQAEELVRFSKRFAEALDAEWIVVSVETPDLLRLSEDRRDRRIRVLQLAESLGAQTVTLDGTSAAVVLLQYARTRNVTRIVVGRPSRRGFARWWRRSTADALVQHAHDIDVSVIAPRTNDSTTPRPLGPKLDPPDHHLERYGYAALVSGACSGIAALMDPWFADANLVMVYLLGAAIAGLRYGRGPAALTAVLNIAGFNFLFVHPRLTFIVSDAEYVVTFAVMLVVALTIATLMSNVRMQTRVAGARERRTALLYAMSRELAATRGAENMARIATRHVAESFASRAAVLLPDEHRRLQVRSDTGDAATLLEADASIAQWAYDHARPAGLGTDALPGAPALYLPLTGTDKALGVLAVLPSNPRRVLLPEQRHLLETFAGQIALALERAQLAAVAEAARITSETESVRNTLLASISHDLRTPLAVISGAGSALADPNVELDAHRRIELARIITDRARDMTSLVSNVLDLVRLESGRIVLRRDWESLDDLVGTALNRVGVRLAEHVVSMNVPAELPEVRVDAPLVTQAIANLLENAAKHTPPGTHVRVWAESVGQKVRLVVDDDGPGHPQVDPDLLFAKFERGRVEGDVPGVGLGLALCRAIIEAHDGTVRAKNRPTGGARFEILLPSCAEAA